MHISRRHLSIGLLAVAMGVAPIAVGAAGNPDPSKPGAPLSPGVAEGSFTFSGKTIHLSHAATFRNDKQVVLLLTDEAVPAAKWKDAGDEMLYRMSGHKFGGVEFYLDDKRQVTAANYFGGDTPTGAKPELALSLDPGTGKTLTGSAHSTPFGENNSSAHLKLDVRFNAPLP
jgi:hypothetical protein